MTVKEDNKKEEQEQKELRIYEVGYCIDPTISEADLPKEVSGIKDILAKKGAQIIAEEFPKMRTLFYPIRGKGSNAKYFSSGYFGWVKFEIGQEIISEIESELRAILSVFRFLIIKTARESTLFHAQRSRQEFRRVAQSAPKDSPASPDVSEQELDKSLEKIISE